MLTERVRVVASDSDVLLLEPMDSPACKSCTVAPACGQQLLRGLQTRRALRLCQSDTAGLNKGSIAHIQLRESKLLSLSFFFYLLPLGAMLLAALLAESLALDEAASVLIAFLAFVGSFMILRSRRTGMEELLLTELNVEAEE